MTIRLNRGLPQVCLVRHPSVEDGTINGLTQWNRQLRQRIAELEFLMLRDRVSGLSFAMAFLGTFYSLLRWS